jgi:hypothetical protein
VAVSHTEGSRKADRATRAKARARAKALAKARAKAQGKTQAETRAKTVSNWLTFLAALGVLVVGIWLLWGIWRPPPVAAAFTRVGGATSVETALEASRFWLIPPQLVVESQADASQQIMLGAAQCAMAQDAPLLFTSPDPKRQQEVDATISDWRKIETTHPEVITVRSRVAFDGRSETLPELTTFQDLPEVITIQNQAEVKNCLPNRDPADVAGLSTLQVPNPLIRLPQVPPQRTLAPVVVFAAAIEPGDPPDVAVGLALAAHMARANREDVSLVVIPHYLESDRQLEKKLQSQHKLVSGGVVLGQTPTVPEDTRALLRELITSTNRQGVLGQVQANLGSVGPLIAALLALAGFGAAAGVAPQITPQVVDGTSTLIRGTPKVIRGILESLRRGPEPEKDKSKPRIRVPRPIRVISKLIGSIIKGVCMPRNKKEPTPARAALLAGLEPDQDVTVWLHSQWKVTGTVVGYDAAMTVLQLRDAKLMQKGFLSESKADMRVPVQDIQLIRADVRRTSEPPEGSASNPSPPGKQTVKPNETRQDC